MLSQRPRFQLKGSWAILWSKDDHLKKYPALSVSLKASTSYSLRKHLSALLYTLPRVLSVPTGTSSQGGQSSL